MFALLAWFVLLVMSGTADAQPQHRAAAQQERAQATAATSVDNDGCISVESVRQRFTFVALCLHEGTPGALASARTACEGLIADVQTIQTMSARCLTYRSHATGAQDTTSLGVDRSAPPPDVLGIARICRFVRGETNELSPEDAARTVDTAIGVISVGTPPRSQTSVTSSGQDPSRITVTTDMGEHPPARHPPAGSPLPRDTSRPSSPPLGWRTIAGATAAVTGLAVVGWGTYSFVMAQGLGRDVQATTDPREADLLRDRRDWFDLAGSYSLAVGIPLTLIGTGLILWERLDRPHRTGPVAVTALALGGTYGLHVVGAF
jgi:hypothetical protein